MNRQLGVLLAVGTVVGIAAVTGAVPLDGGDTQPRTDATQQVDGTVVQSDTETLRLDAAEGQVVSGRTDVAAGETLTIQLVSADASTPFLRSPEATVAENGTFRTTVDLSSISDQPAFELRVRHDGDVLAKRTGEVVGNATDPVGDTDGYERVDRDSEPSTADASFVVEGESLTLAPTEAARLDAETELDAGTQVDVRLRSTDGSTPFLRTQTTTVEDDGTLAATFNMSQTESGTTFDASIHHNESTLTTRSGVVET